MVQELLKISRGAGLVAHIQVADTCSNLNTTSLDSTILRAAVRLYCMIDAYTSCVVAEVKSAETAQMRPSGEQKIQIHRTQSTQMTLSGQEIRNLQAAKG